MSQAPYSRGKIRKLTIAAMLTAITWLMALTPYFGFTLPFFGVGMTFVHIPLIIGLLSEGLSIGTVLGGMFGLTSLFNALTRPTSIYSYMFQNPLVSVLPRLLIAPVLYVVRKAAEALFPKKRKLRYVIVAAFGALTNTVLTLTALTLAHMLSPIDPAAVGMAQSPATSVAAIWALAANVPFEIASAVIITVPVMAALDKINK